MFEDTRTRKNKHVLIAGGLRGIGEATVRQFASIGANVAFLYRGAYREAFELSRETGALNVRCNTADPASVRAAMEVIEVFFNGEIDTLICIAGASEARPSASDDLQRWREILETDLSSAYYCIREVLPAMTGRRKGSILLVPAAQDPSGGPEAAARAAARAGLTGLLETLAGEAASSGVRVNCVMQGGSPEEAARVLEFLASDQAAGLNGQTIRLRG